MNLESLMREWQEVLDGLELKAVDFDDALMTAQMPALTQLASIHNVGVTAFDLLKRTHVFVSYNFDDLFGYDLDGISEKGNDYFDSRMHPEDLPFVLQSGITTMRLFHSLPPEERIHHKVVNEYRVLGAENQYVRIIEQHQALLTDRSGKIRISLGVMDISPNQDMNAGTLSRVLNFRTGKVIDPQAWRDMQTRGNTPVLSTRELEILALIETGKLSKEISDVLSISVHTVNTHRQRILEKLNAGNSFEAVRFAREMGLI